MKYGVTENESKKETGFFLLALLAAAGAAAGTVFAHNCSSISDPLLHQYFFPASPGETVRDAFGNVLISALLFLGAVMLSGVSAVGQPFASALLFFRGFGSGLAAASLYSEHGFRAVPSVLILVLPKAMAMMLVAVLAVREAIRTSSGLTLFMLGHENSENAGAKLYIIRFAVLAVISIIISAGDAALERLFGGLLLRL